MAMKSRKFSTAPANETKADLFRRLGVARVTRAIKAIDSVGKLSGSGYESTPEQRVKIIAALSGAVERVEARFDGQTAASAIEL